MILYLTIVAVLLLPITTSEESCGPPIRDKQIIYDLYSEPQYCLWYKMDVKNTHVDITYFVTKLPEENLTTVCSEQVLSNTQEYKSISSSFIKNKREIKSIYNVTIRGNATMEWIKCNNSESFHSDQNFLSDLDNNKLTADTQPVKRKQEHLNFLLECPS
ncbi:uncharacterized protein [Cherax quadricarinatus]|uniref:uncharacterized protein n=1 Tax=Cherax quadricarinatus TaxID=27406 RepID=UPI00387E2502